MSTKGARHDRLRRDQWPCRRRAEMSRRLIGPDAIGRDRSTAAFPVSDVGRAQGAAAAGSVYSLIDP